jgi:exodeoxyribonuclease VII small subunit
MSKVAELSFEVALSELEAVVQRLEAEELPLQQAIGLSGRGQELLTHCHSLLEDAQLKVQELPADKPE